MYTWTVYHEGSDTARMEPVTADKVIVSDSGVLMFFDEVAQLGGNILVRAFNEWTDVVLEEDGEA